MGPDDAVLSDELNHASIIDGIRLCRAKRLRYKHMDLKDLEEKLRESKVRISSVTFKMCDHCFTTCITKVACFLLKVLTSKTSGD